jgi:hypothetical protein
VFIWIGENSFVLSGIPLTLQRGIYVRISHIILRENNYYLERSVE